MWIGSCRDSPEIPLSLKWCKSVKAPGAHFSYDREMCNYCNLLETLPHMLVECNTVHDFWVKAISWWNSQSGNSYTVDVLSTLYGYFPAERTTRFLNCYILLEKRYIFV